MFSQLLASKTTRRILCITAVGSGTIYFTATGPFKPLVTNYSYNRKSYGEKKGERNLNEAIILDNVPKVHHLIQNVIHHNKHKNDPHLLPFYGKYLKNDTIVFNYDMIDRMVSRGNLDALKLVKENNLFTDWKNERLMYEAITSGNPKVLEFIAQENTDIYSFLVTSWVTLGGSVISNIYAFTSVIENGQVEMFEYLVKLDKRLIEFAKDNYTKHYNIFKYCHDNQLITDQMINKDAFLHLSRNKCTDVEYYLTLDILVKHYETLSQCEKDKLFSELFNDFFSYSFYNVDIAKVMKIIQSLVDAGANVQNFTIRSHNYYQINDDLCYVLLKYILEKGYEYQKKNNDGENLIFILLTDLKLMNEGKINKKTLQLLYDRGVKNEDAGTNIKKQNPSEKASEIKYWQENDSWYD
ncbi:MAG: hypothetical protein Dasosvirus4_2 [Dasosvirus sp.]|uniref:Ankyrin repeat protein n=1 Tax=Dasosvirus sp. TaxID=2487764 RepID=A0A3G4ZTZ9_9VIRU|nr:MAG: hypothetical protein Dasosvirus4_2 [Dasosvirus sp.]